MAKKVKVPKKKYAPKTRITVIFNGKSGTKAYSLDQNANGFVNSLKRSGFINTKEKCGLYLRKNGTDTKILTKESLSHRVGFGDTVVVKLSNSSLTGKHTGETRKGIASPSKPENFNFDDLMNALDELSNCYINPPQIFKNYVIFDYAQLLQKFTLFNLLKCVRWVGTLTNTSEEKRQKQHEEVGRFSSNKDIFVVFHEIGETPSDKRFNLSYHEIWGPGNETNQDREIVKLLDKEFVIEVVKKCLTVVLERLEREIPPEIFGNNTKASSTESKSFESFNVSAAEDILTHQLNNTGASRLVSKVKSSNNNEYRLKPVFGFIEPKASAPLKVTRLNGAPKEDKLVVQFAEAPASVKDSLQIFPKKWYVSAFGGTSIHQLANSGASRLAFKVKITNIIQYFTEPVFGFIEPGSSAPLKVTRLNGAPKEDKLVVQYAEAPAEVTDAQAPFKVGPPTREVVLPLKAE